MATQAEKDDATAFVRSALETAEAACDDIVKGIARGFQLGMMDKIERDTLANDVKAKKHGLLSIHTRLTFIAQRNGSDGVIAASGPGR